MGQFRVSSLTILNIERVYTNLESTDSINDTFGRRTNRDIYFFNGAEFMVSSMCRDKLTRFLIALRFIHTLILERV